MTGSGKTVSSMTGFARASGASATGQWVWELRSVNGRGLELRLRLPPGFDDVEGEARGRIAKAFARGNIGGTLTVETVSAGGFRLNEAALAAVIDAAERVRARVPSATVSADGLLALRGVLEPIDATRSEDDDRALRRDVLAGLDEAVAALVGARQAEGRAVAAVVGAQLARLEDLATAAAATEGRRPDAIRARLTEQLRRILDAAPALDPERLHQEAALIASRADVQEEIDRLLAHVGQAHALLAEAGPVGRRLDFLAQEFGREANTLCSKSNDPELTRIGLELKATIEQFREQVQNLE
ncbi:YicC/YloC family endoribonuclease [Pseudoxanthobacter sp. M-2]|uniref:YicC/YloC family endoribonuclease n=1 Tax=Pseudoxanthobacter sp. M-2 TaxID=3078754 RepID=UPI0038FC8ADB